MIKAIIFDIDGVLLSTKELHKMCFVKAMNEFGYSITEEYHKENLEALPTKVKIETVGVLEEHRKAIHSRKQELTFLLMDHHVKHSDRLVRVFSRLKSDGYKISVCSNAIRDFCERAIKVLGVYDYVDEILSNQDVSSCKPSPEIYETAMSRLGVSPEEAIILEDSRFGLSSAYNSNAKVCVVQDLGFVTYDRIISYVNLYNGEIK